MPISRFRSAAALAGVVAGSLTFLAAPAGAQTCYPPVPDCATTTSSVATSGPTLTLSSTTVARGQQVGASITGFQPGSSGILTIASVEQQVGSFTMPAAGAATSTITIPATISLGAHTVFARGTLPSGVAGSASQNVTVVAAGAVVSGNGSSTTTGGGGTTSTLARTGAVVIPTALVGVGLVLGGMALKRSSRRGKAGSAA